MLTRILEHIDLHSIPIIPNSRPVKCPVLQHQGQLWRVEADIFIHLLLHSTWVMKSETTLPHVMLMSIAHGCHGSSVVECEDVCFHPLELHLMLQDQTTTSLEYELETIGFESCLR